MHAGSERIPNAVPILSAKQIATLRLVQCNLTSKEIARLRGLSRYAIDAQIERAMQQIGATSRIDAARWVMQHVPGPYERFVYEAQPLAALGFAPPISASTEQPVPQFEDGVAEAPAFYVPPFESAPAWSRLRVAETDHALKPATILWLIPSIAFAVLSILFTLLMVGEKATEWADEHLPSYRSTNP